MTDLGRVRTYLLLAVVAGTMVLVVAILEQDDAARVGEGDSRVLAGSLLLACALGIVSALRPNWRRRLTPGPDAGGGGPPGEGDDGLPGPPRRGHHPECEGFSDHTITFRGSVRCAGCTGLAIGAFAMIPFLWLYAARPSALEWWDGLAMVLAGLSLVALDLGVALAGAVDPRAGLGLNALMVLGFVMVSVGLLETTGELTWGLMGLVLSVLWMDTRIQLSRWNHAAVCTVCPDRCVAYSL